MGKITIFMTNNMNYNPTYLDFKPIFNEQEKAELTQLNLQLPLQQLFSSQRNLEDIGIDFVYSSAKLEGNTYDQLDTITLLKLGQTAGGKLYSDAVMLLNLRDSFHFLIEKLDNAAQFDLKAFIKDTHALISEKLVHSSQRGVVRQSSVTIGGTDYQPLSSPNKLDEELNYLVAVSQKYSEPLDKALYLHNNLAYLQYFIDCNKRTARNLMTFVLMQGDYFPLIFNLSNHNDYARAIVYYYETGDYQPFKDYFLQTYRNTVKKYSIKPDVEFTRDFSLL